MVEAKRVLGRKNLHVCNSGKMENEKHLMLECEAYKDFRFKFADIISGSSWYNLFNEENIDKLGGLIINLHKRRTELLKLV